VATGSQLAMARSKKCRKPAKKRGKNYLFNLLSQVEEQQRRLRYFDFVGIGSILYPTVYTS
jgi:hypothetical protein